MDSLLIIKVKILIFKFTIELFFNIKGLFVGSWLYAYINTFNVPSFRCMLGGSHAEVWIKNIRYWFIEGQTHFGMPKKSQNEFGP